MAGLLPRGMMGRVAIVLIVALAVEFAGIFLVTRLQDRNLVSAEHSRQLAGQLVAATRIAEAAPPERRAALMRRMSVGGTALNWVSNTVLTDASVSRAPLVSMRARLRAAEPALEAYDIRMNVLPSDGGRTSDLFGALRLADGTFITFRVSRFLGSPPPFAVVVLMHLAVVGTVLLVALAMIGALVRPLARLADAADRVGRDAPVEIPLQGPGEVRRVAGAFSAMQARLLAMVEDNMQALLAVSHDLRTPIQRLRLRASMLDDEEAARAMATDLDDLEKFVDSVLAFLRGGEEEAPRLVDVAAIAMTAVDNAADAGGNISFSGPDSLVAETRPLALKRALANLIDNSLRHAAHTRVTLGADGGQIRLTVDDDGPGIPQDQRSLALLPFRRLEGPSGNGGGAGLGLAIVRRSASVISGGLALGTSEMGGLAATITFPGARTEWNEKAEAASL